MSEPGPSPLNLGPWIISGIALVQYWVIAAWRRLRGAKLDWYESHNIEIGYSGFGPTLALLGTLTTRHREFFVRSISAKITRKADNLTRIFQWQTFRSHKIALGRDEPTDSEMVSSFLLSPQQPFKFSIFFRDAVFVAELNPKVVGIVAAWSTFLIERAKVGVEGAALEAAYREFSMTSGPVESYTALDRSFYWTSGEYALEVRITGRDGKTHTLRTFAFAIAQQDEVNLRSNVLAILRFVCDSRLPVHFNFAYPKYQYQE